MPHAPVKQCNFCGMLNVLLHANNYSPDDPKSKELNETVNGQEIVKWRCGCCLGDLAVKIGNNYTINVCLMKDIQRDIWGIGLKNQIDALLAQGYGDSFDKQKEHIKE